MRRKQGKPARRERIESLQARIKLQTADVVERHAVATDGTAEKRALLERWRVLCDRYIRLAHSTRKRGARP